MENRPSLLSTIFDEVSTILVKTNSEGSTAGLAVAVPLRATVTDAAPDDEAVKVAECEPAAVGA